MMLQSERFVRLRKLHRLTEDLLVDVRKDGLTRRASWAARDREGVRAVRVARRAVTDLRDSVGTAESVAKLALRLKKPARKSLFGLRKDADPEFAAELDHALRLLIKDEAGAQVLLDWAMNVTADAGQWSLEALGLGETWRWAHLRAAMEPKLGIWSSKLIAKVADTHTRELSNFISEATKPEAPVSIGDLTTQIRQRWDDLTRRQAETIARTETARVWEAANYQVMKDNGIAEVRWLVASGPSIGRVVGGREVGEVCDDCLENAAAGWVEMKPGELNDALTWEASAGPFPSGDTTPPAHPNCRCTLIPRLQLPNGEQWLPPMSEDDMPDAEAV